MNFHKRKKFKNQKKVKLIFIKSQNLKLRNYVVDHKIIKILKLIKELKVKEMII